jgi:hypothetical protein
MKTQNPKSKIQNHVSRLTSYVLRSSSLFLLPSFLILLILLPFISAFSQTPLPSRNWGTYYGGTGNEVVLSMCVDHLENLIICGSTDSQDNIATPGAYQETLAGGNDAFLAKFSPDGTRLWGTYFGGPMQESGWCCRTDSLGNIYLSGHTLSVSVIATPGSHQSFLRGERDAFLAKFSSGGSLLWATYFGGDNQEAGYGCEVEQEGAIYLTGYTNSINFISTPASHQQAAGGDYDGFLAKFTGGGQQIWGTYYGGILTDAGSSCQADDTGNLYLVGISSSPNSIATSGTHQNIIGGYSDAFLVKFDTSGDRVWGTYMGGEFADDGVSIALDPDGFPYISGYTQSTSQISSPGSFQETLAGATDGFLVKFSTEGSRIWSTYYGGEEMDEVKSCSASDSGILISGYTASETGIASAGAFQPAIGGLRDAFLVKFNLSGSRLWGTYYGGEEDEMGYPCAATPEELFLAGYTASPGSISTPGSLQPVFGGGDRDGFVSSFSEMPVGIRESDAETLIIFPNPSSGSFTISGKQLLNKPCLIEIRDLAGRLIVTDQYQGNEIVCKYNLSLPPGTYIIVVKFNHPDNSVIHSLITIY